MRVVLVAGKTLDALEPGDLLAGTVQGQAGVRSYVLACPQCGILQGVHHHVEIHGDGTVTFWGLKGVGTEPRSVVCVGCKFHYRVDRGEARKAE